MIDTPYLVGIRSTEITRRKLSIFKATSKPPPLDTNQLKSLVEANCPGLSTGPPIEVQLSYPPNRGPQELQLEELFATRFPSPKPLEGSGE